MRILGPNLLVWFLVLQYPLDWSKITTLYLICWLSATMFSSNFALVAACTVKGIVCYRRVCLVMCLVSD